MSTEELSLNDLDDVTGGTGESKPAKKFATNDKVNAKVGPSTIIACLVYGTTLWDSANKTWLYNVKEENGNRYWNQVKEENITAR